MFGKIARGIITAISIGFFTLALASVSVSAQNDGFVGIDDCNTVSTTVDVEDIFSPGEFMPIVPRDCAIEDDGQARALSLSLIPVVLIRAFGFIASMVMYLFTFMLVFSGVQYMWGGVDGNSDKKALRNIQDSSVAILLVVGAYIVVFTILDLFQIQNLDTDLNRFFEE